MAHQQMPFQPRHTGIALRNHESRPYANMSMDTITIGMLKLYPSQRYSFKNHVLVLVCLNSGHITLKSICSLSSKSIGLVLQRLDLRYSTKVNLVYSDNYSTFQPDSLGQVAGDLQQMRVSLIDLKDQELDIEFLPNLSYIKQCNYCL